MWPDGPCGLKKGLQNDNLTQAVSRAQRSVAWCDADWARTRERTRERSY